MLKVVDSFDKKYFNWSTHQITPKANEAPSPQDGSPYPWYKLMCFA